MKILSDEINKSKKELQKRIDAYNEALKKELILITCKTMNVLPDVYSDDSRSPKVVLIRNYMIYILREKLGYTCEQAGAFFNKDHATVVHSKRKISKLFSIYENDIQETERKLKLQMTKYKF